MNKPFKPYHRKPFTGNSFGIVPVVHRPCPLRPGPHPCAPIKPLDPHDAYINASVKYGFNVTTAGIVGGVLSLSDAISDVPKKYRCLGQVITFYTVDDNSVGEWVTYKFMSTNINDYERSAYWVNIFANELGDADNIAASQALVSQVQSELESQISTASEGSSEIADQLSQEIADRKAADDELQSAIDAAVKQCEQAASDVEADIEAEAKIRANADTMLLSDIDVEAKLRESADDVLQANIDAEADKRQAAMEAAIAESKAGDVVLKTLISDEALQRESTDTTLQTEIDDLQNQINKLDTTSVSIVKVTPSDENVEAAYQLQDSNSKVLGATINIPKDRFIEAVALSTTDATYDPETKTFTPGTGDAAICFAFVLNDGSVQVVAVDLESYISDVTYGDGLTTDGNHVVSVLIDPNSDEYISVSETGVKISGITDAISAETSAREAADSTIESNVNSLDERVTVLEQSESGDITELEQKISELESLVSELESTVSTLESSNEQLEKANELLEKTVSALESTVTNQGNMIDELESRVAALEAEGVHKVIDTTLYTNYKES